MGDWHSFSFHKEFSFSMLDSASMSESCLATNRK